jgi:hypothetical protein
VGCEPLADLEHCGTNPEPIHVYENSWPRPATGWAIDVAWAGSIIGLNLDLVHDHVLAQAAADFPQPRPSRDRTPLSGMERSSLDCTAEDKFSNFRHVPAPWAFKTPSPAHYPRRMLQSFEDSEFIV